VSTALNTLVDAITRAAPLAVVAGNENLCRRRAHRPDTHAAALEVSTVPPDPGALQRAGQEGWIAVQGCLFDEPPTVSSLG